MPTISTYTPGLALPQYTPTSYDTSLEMALLAKKQSQYNNIVSRLSNLQSTALNINMLNMKGKEKLDQYNKEIDEMLSQDLGDLGDAKIQAKVAGVFSKISQDSDLKKRSQLSNHYQKQMNMIESMRSAKDPTKSGYNQINETVFKKWDGGLEDFMMADDVNGWESKMQSYTPFKDIDQKLVNLTKLLHAESQTTQKPMTQKVTVNGKEIEVPTGYDVLESTSGVSAERIRTLLETTLDQDERAQLDVLAKYRIIENSTSEGKASLYTNYDRWLKNEHYNTKKQLEQIKGLKLQFDPSKVDSNLSPEEQAVKKAMYQNELDKLNQQEQYLTQKLGDQLTNQFTQDEWMSKNNNEILPFIRQMSYEGYVNGISDALSRKNEVLKVGMDESYFANLRIKNMQDRLALDAELGRAGLRLRELALAHDIEKSKKESTPSFGTPTDIIKSETQMFPEWQNLTDTSKEFNNKTTPIITGRDDKGEFQIDPKNLVNRQWLDANKDNHEVRLWNVYVSKFRNSGAFLDEDHKKPNLAGFDAFKKQVNNGDYKNDPSINEITNDYERDQEIGTWLNQTLGEVAQTINNTIDYRQAKVGDYSLLDYAKANDWTPDKGEMTFGIPNGKGGFTQMTWTEVKEELKKEKEQGVSTINPVTGQPYRSNITLLDNDPGFKQAALAAMALEERSNKEIQEIYLNKLPQFLQGKHSISSDPKTITGHLGFLNTATKLAGEDGSVALSDNDVKQIAVPVGTGKYGYFSLTDSGAKTHEGHKLVDVSGNPVSPVAGQWYRYQPPVMNQYDAMLNAKFEDTGFVTKNIKGYKVEVSNDYNENKVRVIIKGPDANKELVVLTKDVSLIFKEVESHINMLNTKPK